MQAAANAGNQWVALTLRIDASQAEDDEAAAWHAVFASGDLLSAMAPLDCLLLISTPTLLTPALLALMPSTRVMFAIDAAAMAGQAERQAAAALQQQGYRVLLDGADRDGVTDAPTLRAISLDCSAAAPAPGTLAPLFGPHLARGVDSAERRDECARAGFSWFCGDYPIRPPQSDEQDDGSSRKRLLNLLGLLADDADTREVEALLKQDPTLSYHLLKLVNSAAFAPSTPISSFSQAIGLLGRRQLQRWLQLLLYVRQRADGLPNPLLPVAALRAAQMESLCKQRGGDRETQDLAFMVGVFSLLDVLLGISMQEIADALRLAPDPAAALIARDGSMGRLLALVEAPSRDALLAAGVTPAHWWQSQLHAYHWAIQVSRNL
ncbi:HDOD domain-containing protein [Massilia sp. R2A-15]|uniref:HDOD domain-containing protein n=1 Tax=Massilia sp. R2A-15 TaxID=3064278 RepID=UPI002736F5D5|nr:HDOD domain-containing protein [Massilia sp. R2A-15]WLI90399.1 HDOD domain-containing protein [Massilia sp. R2A-15]